MATEASWRTAERDDLAKLIWETDPPDHRRSWDRAYRIADAILARAGATAEDRAKNAALVSARALLRAARSHLATHTRSSDFAGWDDALIALRDALHSDEADALLATEAA